MCRILSLIPSQLTKEEILFYLNDMEGMKTGHGFGYGYVDKNKQFFVKKSILSFSDIMKKKSRWDFFGDVFKHDGFVIFHSRKASIGDVNAENVHPFILDNFIGCHNGTLKDTQLLYEAMDGDKLKFESTTDSEVGFKLLEKIGLLKFTKLVNESGVFLKLNRDGILWAIKTNYIGDLKVVKLPDKKFFVASEVPHKFNYEYEEMSPGFVIFKKSGHIFKTFEKNVRHNIIDHNEYGSSVKSTTIYQNGGKIEKHPSLYKKINSMTEKEYADYCDSQQWLN